MKKGTSIFKKIKSLSKELDPAFKGMENYRANDYNVEKLAKERAEVCRGCELRKEEPISFLKVKDERIKSLEGKICGACGCALPYLLRQSQKVCKYWNE